jgi:two-component SAPR family response regulator/LysM repeat protein
MNAPSYVDDRIESTPRPLPFVGFVAILAASGAFLYAISGLPHLPARVPSGAEILITLQGSYVPLEWFAYAFTTAAWILWIWIVGSLVLRLITTLAELVTRGAAWAKSLRAATDRFTLPIVRRVVDGAVVAVVVVNLVTRAPTASAAPLHSPAALVADAPHPRPDPPTDRPVRATRASSQDTNYTVKLGDTLWSISERFYGTGEEFPRLVDANNGRRMPDGNVFTRAGVIQPGWVLRVPLPSKASQSEGGQTYYVVQKGDTLRGIAARFLGDENRWPSIYDLNRGKARLADGRALTNPDLIWPDLRLRLPVSESNASPAPAAPAPAQPAPAQPAPAQPPVTSEPVLTPRSTPSTSTPIAFPTPAVSSPVAVQMPTTVPRVVAPSPATNTTSPLPSPIVEGAAAAAVVAAGAIVLARRRFRRSLDEPADETTPPPSTLCNDFAEAELARTLAHRLESGEIEPVEVVAAQTQRFLRERGIDDAAILLARHATKAMSLLVEIDPRDEGELAEIADELGTRLGGQGRATITPERDVVLKLSGLKLTTLALPVTDDSLDRPLLVPVGVLAGGETLYVAWGELGHVLIAAQPGGGGDVILTTVLAGLAARRRPDELRLVTIARQHGLPPQLASLPHQAVEVVDLDDEDAVARTLQIARGELLRRMARDETEEFWQATSEQPPIVIAIEEIADVEDDGTTLEILGSRGASHGITLLAATAHADELGDDLLGHFTTRVVLQTLDDADSIRLLGRPDAVDLGSAEFLARVAGRAPLRVRGFRVSDAHLDGLVTLLRSAYGERPPMPVVRSDADVPRDGMTSDNPSPRGLSDDDQGGTRVEEDKAGEIEVSTEASEQSDDAESPHAVQRSFEELVGASSANHAAVGSAERNGRMETVAVVEPASLNVVIAEPSHPVVDVTQLEVEGQRETLPQNGKPNEADSPVEDEVASVDAPSDDVSDRRHPIQVRCLGRFVVTSGGHELSPVLNDRSCHKAWELLALLAARPDGAMPKDQILAALWPDTDEEYAMQNLHQTGSRLRRSLRAQVPDVDDDVVCNGRDGIYRLDPAQVWSDAHRFATLCSTAPKLSRERAIAALHQARRLYRAELLADQAYKWPTDRFAGVILRTHYAELYRQATCRMARLLCEEGQTGRAVNLYKGLLKLEPTLEDVVRGLYRCYQQLGDLGSLLREDQELRQALREAFGDKKIDAGACEPSAPTRELFRQIRAELEARARGAKNGHAPTLIGKAIRG